MVTAVTFSIIGQERLACEGCEQRVERLLKALSGIRQVRAKSSNQTVEVLFDTAVVNSIAISQRLEKAGYETRVVGSTPDSTS